jgi:hypothetical protein
MDTPERGPESWEKKNVRKWLVLSFVPWRLGLHLWRSVAFRQQ